MFNSGLKSIKQCKEIRANAIKEIESLATIPEANWYPEHEAKLQSLNRQVEQCNERINAVEGTNQQLQNNPDANRRLSGPCLGDVVRAMVAPASKYVVADIMGSMGRDSGAGFIVPTRLSEMVSDLARASSVLSAAGMAILPISGDTTIAKLIEDPEFEIKSENELFADAEMDFGAVRLVPSLIGCFISASRELAEDAPNFSTLVQSTIANALAVQIDKAGIQGMGPPSVVGLLQNPVIGETGTFGSMTWAKLSAEATTIRNANYEPTAAILNPTTRDGLLLSTASGSGEWLSSPPTLSNVQVLATTNVPAGSGVIGDFRQMILGLRQDPIIEMTTTDGETFRRHQVGIKITFRGDFAILRETAFRRMVGIS